MNALPVAAVVIAGVSAVSASTVAIVAIRAQGREAKLNREHAWNLAREERIQHGRADTYTDALVLLSRLMTVVERTQPIFKPANAPEPPLPMPDEEVWPIQARFDAFGSDEMQELLEQWGAHRREFHKRAELLALTQAEEQRGVLPSQVKETWGYMPSEQWPRVEEARQQLRDKVTEIRKHANEELRGVPAPS